VSEAGRFSSEKRSVGPPNGGKERSVGAAERQQ
jgi:hypothetical protein